MKPVNQDDSINQNGAQPTMAIKNINLIEANKTKFTELQKICMNHICNRLGMEEIDELDKLNRSEIDTRIGDLRSNDKLNIDIDNIIRYFLKEVEINCDFIQFPLNLRILMPGKDEQYLNKEYNVDSIHCDHWSGSPEDSSNCYLYLRKPSNSPELIHFEIPGDAEEIIQNYRGPYQTAPRVPYRMIKNRSYEGLLQVFDCNTPHMVQRTGDKATVSLDFRLRDRTRVFEEDLIEKNESAWANSKMTSLCVYWKNDIKEVKTIEEKIKRELELTSELGEKYKDLRVEYCKRFYSYSESP